MNKYRAIEGILRRADEFDWTLQGFGMFRLYLGDSVRLHVWDDRFRVEDPSDIHDHPWDLHSEIVSGRMVNQRFRRCGLSGAVGCDQELWMCQRIRPGEGGGPIGQPDPVTLLPVESEEYGPGDTYQQCAQEIHRSQPSRGTVTLATRTNRRDADVVLSFFRPGGQWVSAEPRVATRTEIRTAASYALQKLVEGRACE
jgi:hypothetical protein